MLSLFKRKKKKPKELASPKQPQGHGKGSRHARSSLKLDKNATLVSISFTEPKLGVSFLKGEVVSVKEKAKSLPGIYRGVKHGPLKTHSDKPTKGIYRGVSWAV